MSRNKQMLIYILKRLGLMILTFVAIFFICFVMVRLLPVNVDSGMKDPEIFYINMVAQGRMRKNANGEYENIPVLEQLGTFLARLFNPSTSHRWGYSYKIEWLSGPDEVLFKRLIISHRKDLLKGDYLVDDRGKNGTTEFEGEWIEFGSKRFPDWNAVLNYLDV